MSSAARRRAREIALQVLYTLDVNPELSAEAALTQYFDRFLGLDAEGELPDEPPPKPAGPQPPARGDQQRPGERPPQAGSAGDRIDRPFLDALVRGVSGHRIELDERLGQLSRNWRVERIGRVERNILRLALFELEERDDIPARVTLNEAIELAKAYGAEDAPAFVNGLLDSALHAPGSKASAKK
jgi:transcription antitermination factor NusB